MPRHVTSRARTYSYDLGEPRHGTNAELAWEVLLFVACAMFVFGSICFFDGLPGIYFKIGSAQFIVASLIYVAAAGAHMQELFHAKGDEAVTESEFLEQLAYLVSAVVFAVGTILFDERIYFGNEHAAETGELVAAWSFFFGSMGFGIATFFNAVTMSKGKMLADFPTSVAQLCYRLTVMCLFCCLMGSLLFTTGSYLYQPNLSGGCKDWKTRRFEANKPAFCLRIIDQGTIMYLIGSCFYMVASVCGILKILALKRASHTIDSTSKKIYDCMVDDESQDSAETADA